jgi:hypothetical protein
MTDARVGDVGEVAGVPVEDARLIPGTGRKSRYSVWGSAAKSLGSK